MEMTTLIIVGVIVLIAIITIIGILSRYGNENTAGSFMAKTAENLNPAFELLKSIPFKKTFKEMFVEDNPTEDNFEAVK